MVVNVNIIARGINQASVLSFSIKIFFTAGSNNQAIAEELAATITERPAAKKIYLAQKKWDDMNGIDIIKGKKVKRL